MDKNPSITPAQYKEILSGLEIRQVYLASCKVDLNRKYLDALDTSLKVDVTTKSSYENIDDRLDISTFYTLKAFGKKKSESTIVIQATYISCYTTSISITDDFFDIYKDLNIPLNIWPYFREFIQNMIVRMNCPPLTLPFFKPD